MNMIAINALKMYLFKTLLDYSICYLIKLVDIHTSLLWNFFKDQQLFSKISLIQSNFKFSLKSYHYPTKKTKIVYLR